MPRLIHKYPRYRHHKASDQAVVTLNGKDHYLGPHGTKASKAEYDRLIACWLANGRDSVRLSPGANASLTISELILRYWLFAKLHYRRDGWPTRELDNIRDALRPLREQFGSTPAAAFGPKALKTLRNTMIQADLARSTINFRISKVRRAFRWAVENELVKPEVYQGLMSVTGLRPGRDGVRETHPVTTVPETHVAAVLPHVSGPVRAMIQLQSLTGMRPGEVTAMRGMDIDRSGEVWVYRPASHKTMHHGRERVIPLGPKARVILEPFLGRDPGDYLFDPRDAVASRNLARKQARKTPVPPSQVKRKPKRHPKRRPRRQYDKNAYGQAIRRGCAKAGVPAWHPNQLRHNVATRIRQQYGIEAARQLLGHRSIAVTQVYAEADAHRVIQIMAETG